MISSSSVKWISPSNLNEHWTNFVALPPLTTVITGTGNTSTIGYLTIGYVTLTQNKHPQLKDRFYACIDIKQCRLNPAGGTTNIQKRLYTYKSLNFALKSVLVRWPSLQQAPHLYHHNITLNAYVQLLGPLYGPLPNKQYLTLASHVWSVSA